MPDSSVFSSDIPTDEGELLYVSSSLDVSGRPNLKVTRLQDGRYFGFFYGDGARYAVARDGRKVHADWPQNYTLEDACTYLLGPVIAFVLRLRGLICLHASAVVLGGQAVALFGLGGAGKSTTAAAFALDGEPVLSDDVVVLSDQGDQFLVQPGYPRVNLWPDSVEALFGSGDALPKITPTWNKRYLALDKPGHRFHSTPLPLGAIYILGERAADSSLPVIEEVGGNMAMISMVANTYVNYLLDPKMRKEEFLVLSRMLAKVPLRWVRPSANPSRVFELSRAIASDARCLMPSSMRIEARNAGE